MFIGKRQSTVPEEQEWCRRYCSADENESESLHTFTDNRQTFGVREAYTLICSKFYRPMMKSDFFDHCSSCTICQKQKIANNNQKTALVSIEVEKPWELLGIDVAGPLKPTRRVYKYFIVTVDYVSKYLIY